MAVIQQKVIESSNIFVGTSIIRLCGRKGFRYLEYEYDHNDSCWYLGVSDDVSLDEVDIKSYDTDRGEVDSVTLNIDGKEYLLERRTCDRKEWMMYNEGDILLGQLFDEIKDELECSDDEEAKDLILENHRLLKILDTNGLVNLAKQIDNLSKQIDQLKMENINQANQINLLNKQLDETKSLLIKEKQLNVDNQIKINDLNDKCLQFENKLLDTVKQSIINFKY